MPVTQLREYRCESIHDCIGAYAGNMTPGQVGLAIDGKLTNQGGARVSFGPTGCGRVYMTVASNGNFQRLRQRAGRGSRQQCSAAAVDQQYYPGCRRRTMRIWPEHPVAMVMTVWQSYVGWRQIRRTPTVAWRAVMPFRTGTFLVTYPTGPGGVLEHVRLRGDQSDESAQWNMATCSRGDERARRQRRYYIHEQQS